MDTGLHLRLLALGAALLLGSCALEASEREPPVESEAPRHGAPAATSGGAFLEGAGPWTTTATDGSRVTLSADPAPLAAGPVALTISVHRSADGVAARSLDLVSPSMPMHGLVRYEVVGAGVELEIPMEGRWAMYINLDESGTQYAEFVFDAAPAEAGGHMHHGGS